MPEISFCASWDGHKRKKYYRKKQFIKEYKTKRALSMYLITVEPRQNKPLYNEVLSITNDFPYLSNSKTYGKVPWYNKTSL